MAKLKVSRKYAGRASGPISSFALSRIFDSIFGNEARSLPKYPNYIGSITAAWNDSIGNKHEADYFDEVLQAYEKDEASFISFQGWGEGIPFSSFLYIPKKAEAHIDVEAEDEATAERIIGVVKGEFPLAARYVFISYDTEELAIADYLKKVLERRVGRDVSVFVAKRDIKPGANPLKTMLEENLLQAEALLALCSSRSKSSPWLWWESSAVWAKGGLVIPLFVDLSPNEFDGPLTLVCQGRYFFNKEDMNAALRAIVDIVSPGLRFVETTSDEIAELEKLRKELFSGGRSVYEDRGILFLDL